MTNYLSIEQLMKLYGELMVRFGGKSGVLDADAIKTCLEQPQQSGFGVEYYPTIASKTAVLGFLLAMKHPFIDGNKRIAFGAMEVFLLMNGYKFIISNEDAEKKILNLASGEETLVSFTDWLASSIEPIL